MSLLSAAQAVLADERFWQLESDTKQALREAIEAARGPQTVLFAPNLKPEEIYTKIMEAQDGLPDAAWDHLFYFVAAQRSNKEAPSLEKACGEKLFTIKEDAEKYCAEISKEVGYQYRVFEALAVIPRKQT